MKAIFEHLCIAFNLVACTSAARHRPSNEIAWLQSGRSAVVKVDTHGYPLWLMDKANAPVLHKDSENFYWPQDKPSAILLNLTMSADNKTLLLNHKAILPLADSNVPPLIEAYQVPADVTNAQIKGVIANGILNRQWEGLTLGWRYLALDYDRVVWADPASGPYQNHVPTLRFRIMGLGAHSRNDVLDQLKQPVLHVTLSDSNQGSSGSPKRSYTITNIEIKSVVDSYAYIPSDEPEQNKDCNTTSWRCPDVGLYQEGAPWYRFIWRERFDQYGRVGSRRHAVFKKLNAIKEGLGELLDAWPAMLSAFVILMGANLFILAIVLLLRRCAWPGPFTLGKKLIEDEQLLGTKEGDEEDQYHDDEDIDCPPPLPPRPCSSEKEENLLIDIEPSEDA